MVGLSKNKNNNGGGAYKRRLRTRKECELGRAAATFEILKKSRFPEGGKVGSGNVSQRSTDNAAFPFQMEF